MGMLTIASSGSFRSTNKTFGAQTRGHAVAIDDAISFLQDFKQEAIIQDLRLREEGHEPDDGFEEADRRGLLDEQKVPVEPEDIDDECTDRSPPREDVGKED